MVSRLGVSILRVNTVAKYNIINTCLWKVLGIKRFIFFFPNTTTLNPFASLGWIRFPFTCTHGGKEHGYIRNLEL